VDLSKLPLVNACLNFSAFVTLFVAWIKIKQGKREEHKRLMLLALAISSIFLVSYVTYHYFHGRTTYQGQGILRTIYFFILATHTPLAMTVVPLAIVALVFAFKGKFESHKKVTRFLYPIWVYVSITGVVIYLMLYVF
jgi:putative membrane protein